MPVARRAQKVGVTFLTLDLKNWYLGRFAPIRAHRNAREEGQGTTGPKSQSWGSGMVFSGPWEFSGLTSVATPMQGEPPSHSESCPFLLWAPAFGHFDVSLHCSSARLSFFCFQGFKKKKKFRKSGTSPKWELLTGLGGYFLRDSLG